MKEGMDHDRRFKELLTVFFGDFHQLVVLGAPELVDGNSFDFIYRELFTDVTSRKR